MATKTEGQHTGEFIASEGNGTQSRNVVTLISGQNLSAGSVLGLITASGKYTLYNPGGADGSQNATAILFDSVDATAGDTQAVVIVSPAEVNNKELNWGAATAPQIVTGRASLNTLGIRVRS